MSNHLFHYFGLVLIALMASCQSGNIPAPLKIEPEPAIQLRSKLPAADVLFEPFYATYQASATYRLAAVKASVQGNPKADSSTLQFIYLGSQLIDKKVRPAGSAALIDVPRKLTFNSDNRLMSSEATATATASQTGTFGDARTEYTYEGDRISRGVRYTSSASGTLKPAVDVTYTYLNGRYASALIISYVSQVGGYPGGLAAVPLFTLQRTYSYSADGRSLVSTDNKGGVVIDAQLDDRGAILFEAQRGDIAPEAYRPIFFTTGLQDVYKSPHKAVSDRYEYVYDGPDGLISEVINRSKGIRYQFVYEKK